MASSVVGQEITALELFEQGYRFGDYRVPGSKTFFIELRQAIITELENYGFCPLLDRLVEGDCRKIDVVVYSVIKDIETEYKEGRYASSVDTNIYIPYISKPETGAPIRWDECKVYNRTYFCCAGRSWSIILEAAREVRELGRKKHKKQIDSTGDKTGGLMQSIQSGATMVRDGIMGGQAQHEADRIRNEAQNEANGIKAQAQREAEQIRAKALQDAEETRREAKAFKDQADVEAKKITEAAQSAARESADSLVNRYLLEQQKQTAQACNEDAAKFAQEYLEKARSADEIHDQMCEELGNYQVAWTSSFDEMRRQMDASKAEFYDHLDKWRASLAPRDWTPLAERYIELYKIINNNIHKQIAAATALRDAQQQAETVFSEENVDGQGQAETADPVSRDTDGVTALAASLENGTMPREGTLEVLQGLDRIFTKALGRFQTTLEGLGLKVFIPKEGEEFDEIQHICEDMDNDPTGKKIVRCILPGVTKQYNNDESTVLVRAEVEVEA